MAKQKSDVMVARETFATLSDGRPFVVRRKVTRLRADDPIVTANLDRFELADAGLPEIEQATATPGQKRGEPTRAELVKQAEAAGVDVRSTDTKADIADKLDEAQA